MAIHDWTLLNLREELLILTTIIEQKFMQHGSPTPSVETFHFHRTFSASDYVKPPEQFKIEEAAIPSESCRL